MNLRKTSEKTLGLTVKGAVYIILIIAMVILATKAYKFGKAVFSEAGVEDAPGTEVTIVIEQGDSNMTVAKKAVECGLAKDQYVFFIQSMLYEAKFKPNQYTINNSLPAEEIISTLSKNPEAETQAN